MARGKAGGTQSSSVRDMKMFLRHRMWYEHRYMLSSAVLFVAVLFGSAFLQFYTSDDHVYRLEVTDFVLMDRVFSSGEPWIVLCSDPDDVLPEVFDKVSPRLAGKSFVGVLDCKQKLPASNKSILKHYGIKKSISPTIFTVSNGERPKQIARKHLQSSASLAKYVKAQINKTMQQVQNSAQLDARCLSKSICVLLLRGKRLDSYEKQWIDKLMHKHRTLSFVWIDSTSLKLSLENMLPGVEHSAHRLVLFRRQHDLNTHKMVLAAKAYRGGVFNAASVGMFLDDYAHADLLLKRLTKSPKILHRRRKASKLHSEQGDSERRQHHRHKTYEADEEKSNDYDFPQHIELEEDDRTGSIKFGEVGEEEEVLDLDSAD